MSRLAIVLTALLSSSVYANNSVETIAYERNTSPAEVKSLLNEYSLKKEDFKEANSAAGCGEDSDLSKKTINLISKNKVVTKDFVLPANSRFTFCDSELTEVYIEATNESQFLNHKCDGLIKILQRDKSYECSLFTNTKFEGVELPAGMRVFFDRESITSFGIEPETIGVKVKGVKLIPNTLYMIKDGKPAIKYGN